METQTKLGMNRTGVQMSPFDVRKLVRDIESEPSLAGFDVPPSPPRSAIRNTYFAEGGLLGSVPPPGSLSGAFESAKELLSGHRPQVLIDKLGERLAFERTGVRLYEALLAKCEAQPDMLSTDSIAALERFKDEELEHFLLVRATMLELGADPTAQTPCANLVGVESQGLMQAVTDPRTTPQQALHAIFNAELVDNAGWASLIELAANLRLTEVATRFEMALQQENEHLAWIQSWLKELTMADALRDTPTPAEAETKH